MIDLDRQLRKIATLRSIEEIDGYAWGTEAIGRQMLPEEKIALQRRREALAPRNGRAA